MYSRRNLLIATTVGFVLLSACRVEIDVATEVHEDGSGEIAATVMLGETARETLRTKELKSDDPQELADLRARGEDVFARGPQPLDVLEETVPAGWRSERVEEGKIQGLRLRAEFADVDEIPGLLEPFDDWGDELAAQQGGDADQAGVGALVRGLSIERDGPLFALSAEPDVSAYEGATGGPNKLLAEFTISVKLPGGIREHNADEKTDGALVWHIAPGTSPQISATSDLTYDPFEIPWTPIAVGGATAGVIGLLVLRALRDRHRSSDGHEPPGPAGVHEDVPAPV